MEPSIKDYENTVRILTNTVKLLASATAYTTIDDAAKAVEAYAFLQGQLRDIQTRLEALKNPQAVK